MSDGDNKPLWDTYNPTAVPEAAPTGTPGAAADQNSPYGMEALQETLEDQAALPTPPLAATPVPPWMNVPGAPAPSTPEITPTGRAIGWGCSVLIFGPFVLAFLIAFLVGTFFLFRNTGFVLNGERTTGIVTSVEVFDDADDDGVEDGTFDDDDDLPDTDGPAYCGDVSYRVNGEPYTFDNPICDESVSEGDKVEVIYKKDDPSDAKAWSGVGQMFVVPFVATLPFLGCVYLVFWAARRKARQTHPHAR